MGSGSYLGGSTVVHGGWAWSGKSGLSRPKKKKTSVRVSKNSNWIKNDTINVSGLTPDERKDRLLFRERRTRLLRKIVKNNNIKLSDKERRSFINKINKKGSLIKWAECQSQYKRIKNNLKI